MESILLDYFSHLNDIEQKQKNSGTFHFDFPSSSIKTEDEKMVFLDNFFLDNKNIFISKHNRFADYPKHTHEFLEMNYMLSGQCTQLIEDETLSLTAGNILLLDKGSSHSIQKLGENDILINIIFKNKGMDLEWLTTLNQQNTLVFDFLMRNVKESTEGNYFIFNSSGNKHVQEIVHRIIHEYFLGNILVDNMISMYIPILITELVANVPFHATNKQNKQDNLLTINVLKEIEANYASTSLSKVAEKLGYNKNYLSNTVKNSTGFTFTELLNQERMKQAKFLLMNSNKTIEEIMGQIGLQNKTYFYKIFNDYYKMTPKKFRTYYLKEQH